MRFLLLLHHDEAAFRARPEVEQRALLEEAIRFAHELAANGGYLDASPLRSAAESAIVRVRDGRRFVTDGPFIETKEQVGGYFLIEASDLQEAVAIAERIPAARFGSVEVRPLLEVAGLPRHG